MCVYVRDKRDRMGEREIHKHRVSTCFSDHQEKRTKRHSSEQERDTATRDRKRWGKGAREKETRTEERKREHHRPVLACTYLESRQRELSLSPRIRCCKLTQTRPFHAAIGCRFFLDEVLSLLVSGGNVAL